MIIVIALRAILQLLKGILMEFKHQKIIINSFLLSFHIQMKKFKEAEPLSVL